MEQGRFDQRLTQEAKLGIAAFFLQMNPLGSKSKSSQS